MKPPIFEAVSNGRPLALPLGPDGTPMRVSLGARPSASAPGRIKVCFAGPLAGAKGGTAQYVKVGGEFRLELN